MLVRMGEADAARALVQSVDPDQYSKRLYAVAMQAYLASADPVGLCSIQQGGASSSSIAELAHGGSDLRLVRRRTGPGERHPQPDRAARAMSQAIDYRLTEKIVGAGANARRSVKIEWDGVDRLTAWRYGLATAANVDIPEAADGTGSARMCGRGRRVRRCCLPPPACLRSRSRRRLGVFSSSALVDFYSGFEGQEELPEGLADRLKALREAYAGTDADDRLGGMRTLWTAGNGWDIVNLLALSRAAAALPLMEVNGAEVSHLVAAMLSAGYDTSALRWASAAEALAETDGTDGWAMLCVGAPRMAVRIDAGRLRDYAEAGLRGRMALAGLAGLGRIGGQSLKEANDGAALDFRARSRWERAIGEAARRGEQGTVAILAAVGMQTTQWSKMVPEHLYHIVAALHRVGLDPEARMIAAEAIMRS
jgi:hypothetical protein